MQAALLHGLCSSISNEPSKRKTAFKNGYLVYGLRYEMKILGDHEPYEEFEMFLADHIRKDVP